MPFFTWIARAITLAAIAVLLAARATAAPAAVGKIRELSGAVTINGSLASADSIVSAGDVVQANRNAWALIELPDSTRVVLGGGGGRAYVGLLRAVGQGPAGFGLALGRGMLGYAVRGTRPTPLRVETPFTGSTITSGVGVLICDNDADFLHLVSGRGYIQSRAGGAPVLVAPGGFAGAGPEIPLFVETLVPTADFIGGLHVGAATPMGAAFLAHCVRPPLPGPLPEILNGLIQFRVLISIALLLAVVVARWQHSPLRPAVTVLLACELELGFGISRLWVGSGSAVVPAGALALGALGLAAFRVRRKPDAGLAGRMQHQVVFVVAAWAGALCAHSALEGGVDAGSLPRFLLGRGGLTSAPGGGLQLLVELAALMCWTAWTGPWESAARREPDPGRCKFCSRVSKTGSRDLRASEPMIVQLWKTARGGNPIAIVDQLEVLINKPPYGVPTFVIRTTYVWCAKCEVGLLTLATADRALPADRLEMEIRGRRFTKRLPALD